MKKSLRKIVAIQLLFFLFVSGLYAQEVRIAGKVVSKDNNPIAGVTIAIKGTGAGTITDAEGNFTLNVPVGSERLIFSFIGMKSKEVAITSSSTYHVVLEEDTYNLEEVVAVGYGTMKKSDLTGSVASVNAKNLTAYPATNVMKAMAGRAPGVFVQQNNSAPGGGVQVRIRGTNSISGDNNPLYVIDGFLYNGTPLILQPGDIESMEILKDASATAIYGSRAANGVVLITTKKGKLGKTKVEVESGYTLQSPAKKMDLMNASEYAEFTNQWLVSQKKAAHFDNPASLGEGTDWQDLVLQNAPIYNSALNISGGNEKTQFALGAGYYKEEGIVKNAEYNRFNFRSSISHELSKCITVNASFIYSQNRLDNKNFGAGNRGSDLFGAILLAPPTLTPYNDDGSYRNLQTAYPFSSNALMNPMEYLYEVDNSTLADKILANAAVTIKPFNGFFVKFSGGIDLGNNQNNNYSSTKQVFGDGSASVSAERYQSILNENTAGYSKKWGIHEISAVAGVTFQNYKTTSLSASGNTFISDTPGSYALGAAANFGVPGTSYTDWTILSYLGRIQYSLMNKYLITASFRADGSSRYSDNNKWGFFPSAAFAWKLTEEEFIKSIAFISDLKLRVGYGETGSTAISPYYTLNMLTSGKAAIGAGEATWYAPGTRLPAPLRWETTAQSNFAVDLGVLDSRFRMTVEYYIKNTHDLLNSVQLPASLGYTNTVQNVGEIRNKGLEISLDANIFTGDFKWNLAPNISFNRNKVVKLYGGQQINGTSFYTGNINDYINVLREGEPMGLFYGYKEAGYTDTGDIKCEDTEGNGLSADDRRIIGDPNPDFIYGVNSEMTWKGFDFSFFIQGSQGNDLYNLVKLSSTMDFAYAHNRPRDMINNTWTPENPTAEYPKTRVGAPTYFSDRWVEDGSYVRLKNIQFGYSLPLQKWNLKWITRAQVYVSGQNLITLTDYSGFDPEVNYTGSSVSQGIDYFTYSMPAKSWTFGMKLEF